MWYKEVFIKLKNQEVCSTRFYIFGRTKTGAKSLIDLVNLYFVHVLCSAKGYSCSIVSNVVRGTPLKQERELRTIYDFKKKKIIHTYLFRAMGRKSAQITVSLLLVSLDMCDVISMVFFEKI